MATRSARDNKALNAKHAELLRAMLRRPENRVCADCKRNDPRWASTNLGCFMCIRCSGIHRSMGVHITRIKSIDLDTWTPEQVAFVGRWGNKRANAYWEAHLRAGHIPPDHKMESFIRSKYESKRWAMEGPLPDPDTLDTDGAAPEPAPSTSAAEPAPKPASRKPTVDLLGTADSAPASRASAPSAAPTATATSSAPKPQSSGGGLFDIDFSPGASAAAAVATAPAARKDVKNDILSLFSSAPPPSQPVQPQGTSSLWGGGPAGGNAFGGPAAPVQTSAFAGSPPSHQSAGFGGLTNQFSGLQMGPSQQATQQPATTFAGQPQAPRGRAPSNVDPWGGPGFTNPHAAPASPPSASAAGNRRSGSFGAPSGFGGFASSPPANNAFGGGISDPWATSTTTNNSTASDPFGAFGSATTGGSKNDVFADIWK